MTRLAEDHHRARLLADGLAAIPGVSLDPGLVEINIVVFAVADARAFCTALASRGVLMSASSECLVRAVTHLDVSTGDIEQALNAAESLMQ